MCMYVRRFVSLIGHQEPNKIELREFIGKKKRESNNSIEIVPVQ